MPSPETKPKVRFAPYLPRIFRRAISETAKYWNQYQVAAYLASLTFGAIWQLGQTHKQHANWAALKVVMVILGILLYSIVGLLSGLGLTFLVALACAPSLLDKDCQEEMANCKQENVVLKTALSEPTVSAQEQRQRELVREALKGSTERDRTLLRYLLDQGRCPFRNLAMRRIHPDLYEVVRKFARAGIIVELPPVDSGILAINPNLGSALLWVLENEYPLTAS